MDGLVMTGQLLLGLSILIILHEAGHFLAARAFGIRVEKFYLFFDAWGFKLVSFNYKGCEYGIGWLPLGGYVKISGMIDESMDTDQLAGPPQPWEFLKTSVAATNCHAWRSNCKYSAWYIHFLDARIE